VAGKDDAKIHHENFARGLQRGNRDRLFGGMSHFARLLAKALASGRFGSRGPLGPGRGESQQR